jgi:periplasmic protein TonB
MLTYAFIALLIGLGQGGTSITPSPELTNARSLYASGDYEEALARLSAVHDEGSAAEASEYKAMCLLALGRTADAQRALEDLFTRMPFLKMSDAEVAPRLVTMFQDVRKRRLPALARDIYAKGKASFERKQYAAASSQFNTMLTLLADEDEAEDASGLTDLKLLAEGFQRLAEGELAAAARPAEVKSATATEEKNGQSASVAAVPVPASPAPESRAAATGIYTAADRDVVPPVDVVKKLPAWHPPNTVAAKQEYRGVLRIVVDERGGVESARLVSSVSASYDDLLLAAVRLWQFKPARKDGQAVKYEKMLAISLSPTPGR